MEDHHATHRLDPCPLIAGYMGHPEAWSREVVVESEHYGGAAGQRRFRH